MRIHIEPQYPDPRKIRLAASALAEGKILAYPTDTVYGLGCDSHNKKAMDRLYQVSQKPQSKLLTLMCADLSQVAHYAIVDDEIYHVVRRLWPGPYCLILRARKEVPRHLQTKRRTVGVRVSTHRITQSLIQELGRPIFTTSAVWQEQTIDDPSDILLHYPGVEMFLDAGYGGTTPSTVIDLTVSPPQVLREGIGLVDTILR